MPFVSIFLKLANTIAIFLGCSSTLQLFFKSPWVDKYDNMIWQNSGQHFGKMIKFCSIGIFYKITGKDPQKKSKKKIGISSQTDN